MDHLAIMTHASLGEEARHVLGITDGFIRLSIGVEDADDLKEGLNQGLEKIWLQIKKPSE